MSEKKNQCFLEPQEEGLSEIYLEDGKAVSLGRGPLTRIKDSRCSRSQISLIAHFEERTVDVTPVGRNTCGLNGKPLDYKVTVQAGNGDKVEILHGQHVYKIVFPSMDSSEKTPDNGIAGDSNKRVEPSSDSDEEPLSQPRKRAKLDSTKSLDLSAYNIDPKKVLKVAIPRLKDVPPTVKITPQPKPKATQQVTNTAKGVWETLVDDGTCLVYTTEGVRPSLLIAAYDLDNTLIKTKSGKVFAENSADWSLRFPRVFPKLRDLHGKNYKIVIMTNQGGLNEHNMSALKNFKNKVENIVNALKVPIQVFVAIGLHTPNTYRKPLTGMWDAMIKKNDGITVNVHKSFYCGDAAGRLSGVNLDKPDFSSTDFLFALNIGIPFITPEMHFQGLKTPPPRITTFDPRTIPVDVPLCDPSTSTVISLEPEVVLLVGMPGAGKTHFAQMHLLPAGYVHVNRDTLVQTDKCLRMLEQSLMMIPKRSVVIDNTNSSRKARAPYIAVAKKFRYPIRCFVINTNLNHALHNNKFRTLVMPKAHTVSDAVIKKYKKDYELPSTAEGFDEIVTINFWPTFLNKQHEKLYKMFLLEK